MALRGSKELLAAGRIDLIYSEVLFASTYERQGYFHEICALLAAFGYVLFDFYQLNYARNGLLCWTDAIWLSPQLETARNRGFAARN
jgi:hypothetical protein